MPQLPEALTRKSSVLVAVLAAALVLADRAHAVQDPDETPDPVERPVQEGGEGETGQDEGTGASETEPGDPVDPPVDPYAELAPYTCTYKDHADIDALIGEWIAASGVASEGWIRRVQLETTRGGLSIPAFEWGTPGELPLEARPTFFLLGGLDGVSYAGGEAVLSVASELIRATAQLPRELTFVCVPWASPDGLARAFTGESFSGTNLWRFDDDGDEKLEEDPPDDLDADGEILSMLIPDAEGEWTRASDERFLVRARPGDGQRYRLAREGADNDHDGRFNEDDAGGVNLDWNFPISWAASSTTGRSGTWPLSERSSKSIADLVLSRKAVCVLLFQGNHGTLAHPGGTQAPPWPRGTDDRAYEWAAKRFAESFGRRSNGPRSLYEAHGTKRQGAALDWFYSVPGALSFEVAAWGPGVTLDDAEAAPEETSRPTDAQFQAGAPGAESEVSSGALSSTDALWARWLDNARGGIGFTDWYHVELGGGGSALIGGWHKRTLLNPPDDELEVALTGSSAFVRSLVEGLPRLDIVLSRAERDGSILHLKARVENIGDLPTGVWSTGRRDGAASGVTLELTLPAGGARLLAGEPRIELGPIAGQGASPEIEWIVLAGSSSSSVIRLSASCEWTGPIEVEVRR